MPRSEAEVREEIVNLLAGAKKMRWEKVCLLILNLLPPEKFASNLFIYNKMQEWNFLIFNNANYLRIISRNLYSLYRKKLLVRKDLDILDVWEFKQFCAKNKEGEITDRPFKKRTRFVFRLPAEGEKVRINTLLLKEVVKRMLSRNSL